MSELYTPAFAEPHGAVERRNPTEGVTRANWDLGATGTPTAPGTGKATPPTTGYAPSCLLQNITGTIGYLLYINRGTAAAATWLNIASLLFAVGFAVLTGGRHADINL